MHIQHCYLLIELFDSYQLQWSRLWLYLKSILHIPRCRRFVYFGVFLVTPVYLAVAITTSNDYLWFATDYQYSVLKQLQWLVTMCTNKLLGGMFCKFWRKSFRFIYTRVIVQVIMHICWLAWSIFKDQVSDGHFWYLWKYIQ